MDHDVINIHSSSMSCGVCEVSRLSDEQDKNAFALGTSFYHPSRGQPPAFVLWSNIVGEETNGSRFCRFVEKNKFGKVTQSDTALNPKTSNAIGVWTWVIDHEAFKKWWLDQKIARLRR
jgi:hypothetical protein